MTEQEYADAIATLKESYEKEKNRISREFAFANNTYKIGDLFTDHAGTIKIEVIKWYYQFGGTPSCVYEGIVINKNGKENKRGEKRKAYKPDEQKPSATKTTTP
jgi:hypothetical protein